MFLFENSKRTTHKLTTMADSTKAREVKVVLLGDTGVGKSSLVLRFVTNNFRPYSESTIGASFMSKMLVVNDVPIKYQIWDTAGQEKVSEGVTCAEVINVSNVCGCAVACSITVWPRCTTEARPRQLSFMTSPARYC